MKTIILYATKYGAAAEIARRIACKIDGSAVHNLKDSPPSLDEFDCIILGSSVYAGNIRKEAKVFMSKNADFLLNKKIALYLCGIGAEGEKKYFKSNFSPDILQKAKAAVFLGGIFDPKKANAAERLIIRLITKQSAYFDVINNRKIEKFAEEINK